MQNQCSSAKSNVPHLSRYMTHGINTACLIETVKSKCIWQQSQYGFKLLAIMEGEHSVLGMWLWQGY